MVANHLQLTWFFYYTQLTLIKREAYIKRFLKTQLMVTYMTILKLCVPTVCHLKAALQRMLAQGLETGF